MQLKNNNPLKIFADGKHLLVDTFNNNFTTKTLVFHFGEDIFLPFIPTKYNTTLEFFHFDDKQTFGNNDQVILFSFYLILLVPKVNSSIQSTFLEPIQRRIWLVGSVCRQVSRRFMDLYSYLEQLDYKLVLLRQSYTWFKK